MGYDAVSSTWTCWNWYFDACFTVFSSPTNYYALSPKNVHHFLFLRLLSQMLANFYCATLNAGRSSEEKAIRLSVKHMHGDKTEERSVQNFLPYERSFSIVFWEEEWLVGVTTSTWNFGSTGPRWSRIAAAITPREKVQLTLIGSPLHTFQWA